MIFDLYWGDVFLCRRYTFDAAARAQREYQNRWDSRRFHVRVWP